MEEKPRPASGQILNMVLVSPHGATIVPAVLVYDQGRGLVLEAARIPEAGWARGVRVVMVYEIGEHALVLRGVVSEILSERRCYVQPTSTPTEMERREYIRGQMDLPCAVVPVPGPMPDGPLAVSKVELSASGFRWFDRVETSTGMRVQLILDLPVGDGGSESMRLNLLAEVVRHHDGTQGADTAGHFLDPDPDAIEAIQGAVFRVRLAELGLLSDEVPISSP